MWHKRGLGEIDNQSSPSPTRANCTETGRACSTENSVPRVLLTSHEEFVLHGRSASERGHEACSWNSRSRSAVGLELSTLNLRWNPSEPLIRTLSFWTGPRPGSYLGAQPGLAVGPARLS